MKTRHLSFFVAAALVMPVMGHAQESGSTASTVTRAQVRAELAQLERAGYRPGHLSPYYPADIQAAEARVREMDSDPRADVGGVVSGTAEAGARLAVSGGAQSPLYAHH